MIRRRRSSVNSSLNASGSSAARAGAPGRSEKAAAVSRMHRACRTKACKNAGGTCLHGVGNGKCWQQGPGDSSSCGSIPNKTVDTVPHDKDSI
jgi:hypothetical protein